MIDLSAAGLSPTEAKCYEILLEKPEWKPADLAKSARETRTNCYKILDKLVSYGLAEKFDKAKKINYRATNPSRLLELAREQREARESAEKELELQSRELLREYIKANEQPGIQFFQGEEELKKIYEDQVRTGKPIYLIRSDYNLEGYDQEYMMGLRHEARKQGVTRYAITPDRVTAPKNYQESDAFMLIDRTWLPAGAYTTPVEWDAYGDKVAILSYGNEVSGVIIQSQQIADAFRQLYGLLQQGLTADPAYQKLPKLAAATGPTQATVNNP